MSHRRRRQQPKQSFERSDINWGTQLLGDDGVAERFANRKGRLEDVRELR